MRRNRWWLLHLFTIMLLIGGMLTACASSSQDGAVEDHSANGDDAASIELYSAEDEAESGSTDLEELKRGEEGIATGEIDIDNRKVIYHAQLEIQVNDFNNARKGIEKLVHDAGGYIVQTSQYDEENWISGNLTVRIPQNAFSGFLDSVEQLAEKVPHRYVEGSDVTEEYVDLQSRLKAKEAVEERLLAFMEEAEKTEDLLKISADLGRVQEEIEQITGRMQYLDNQVSYSTVDITVSQQVVIRGVAGEGERNTLASAWRAIIASTNWILDFFSGLVVFLAGALPVLPIIAVVGIPVWLWWKKRNKQVNRSKSDKIDETEERINSSDDEKVNE